MPVSESVETDFSSIIVDPEFHALLPQQKDEVYNWLEKDIIEHGCRNPLALWGNILLDGHTRFEICIKHGIPFEVWQINLETRNDALIWIYENQMFQSMTDAQRAELQEKKIAILAKQAEDRMKAGVKKDPIAPGPQGLANEIAGKAQADLFSGIA